MSEDIKGFGVYNPEATNHGPYNEAMAEWRNQVRSMQQAGTLPGSPEAIVADEAQTPPAGATEQATEGAEDDGDDRTDQSEGNDPAERSMDEALDLKDDGTPKEGNPPEELPSETYDPAQHNAPDVLHYLKGVGYDEAVRVLESEEAGRHRKGIMNLTDEILTQALNNDEQSGSQ